MKRVVVTGMAAITPIGNDWATVADNLKAQNTGIRRMDDWDKYNGLNTRLGGPVDFTRPAHYSRKQVRGMGRVAMLATYATELALQDAGLLNDPVLKSGRTGVSYGSSSGSFDGLIDFTKMLLNFDKGGLNATSYIRMMGHTCPVNISLHFGVNGRIIPTSSACTSSSQGIGYAYEAIKHGQQTVMIAGGSDELSASQAAVFDTLFATSLRNDEPDKSPRPFDRDRDGLVIGEGGGTFILEEREHALSRGATIHAEIVGFGTNCDGLHVTQPDSTSMQVAMQLALQDSGLDPAAIGYVSAHGTATELGDIAESHATAAVLGSKIPISSMKSYTGHTLGACGSIEAWAAVRMMNEGWFHPTANLDAVDPKCAELDYIQGAVRKLECDYLMSNNFAFGGINTSLIFKRV
ncbi:beta-ketoacyl-ACP synthase [Methylotuvimicrobium alcaliphilum]|uniref:Beta-ketoacyl synthase n=1 Tax=Methylotuvimicrobium alcaliphilum (strain DSM 19304 / NCIMB 14124 / VKM B-2133 / 20Z) TaxID=1091494 RepID=G4SW44_META2|nr:Beta-ketoacyl synthase [Methylotuvimicrobium alcaliphilum 20Z]